MATFLNLLASGVALGAILALASLGFLVTHKATGVINFAYGDMITLAAYLGVWASQDLELPLGLAYLVAIVCMALIGVAFERVACAPLRRQSVEVMVIATLGVAIVIRALLGLWRGANPVSLDSPLSGRSLHVAGASISYQRVAIVVVTAVVVVGLLNFFRRSSIGRQLRALAADKETARLHGVRTARLSMFAFGLSGALAGLVGILLGPVGSFDLHLGFSIMLASFAAAILGGFGNLKGAVLGALLIGLVEQLFGGYVWRDYKDAYPYVLMLVVMVWLPHGILRSDTSARF